MYISLFLGLIFRIEIAGSKVFIFYALLVHFAQLPIIHKNIISGIIYSHSFVTTEASNCGAGEDS